MCRPSLVREPAQALAAEEQRAFLVQLVVCATLGTLGAEIVHPPLAEPFVQLCLGLPSDGPESLVELAKDL